MVIIIDATNIRGGGGVTHLVELLKETDPSSFGITKIYVCATLYTLGKIEDMPWLVKYNNKFFEIGTIARFFWQLFYLNSFLKKNKCDLLFIPGGTYLGNWKPFVTMSQNLLPFEWNELKRYGLSQMLIKMLFLRFTQSSTFNKASGIIYLTKYAQEVVNKYIDNNSNFVIVGHGINKRFENIPKFQYPLSNFTQTNPFKILYISSIDVYKHQNYVIEAISFLHKEGFPVLLELVGSSSAKPLQKMNQLIEEIDPENMFVKYFGALPYESIEKMYKNADLFLCASSCETFGQIVTEAMSAGLPIACSNKSALPEVLGDCGVYFDPEDPKDIASKLKLLLFDPQLRTEIASKGFNRSKEFSWNKCANETFMFLSSIANMKNIK
jgi:glycosyltransferase involved in cell wall biosynthesis